jgi:hypothetical protein
MKPGAALIDPGVLSAPTQFVAVEHIGGPGQHPEKGPFPLSLGRNRQAFAAFGSAALEDDAAILGLHAHQEAVRAAAAAPIGLERTFHRKSSGKCKKAQPSNL